MLQPLTMPSSIWSDFVMDFIEGFPHVGGISGPHVADRLSKYAHFLALGHPYSATSIAKVFFEQVV
jgi:hypothetical protein